MLDADTIEMFVEPNFKERRSLIEWICPECGIKLCCRAISKRWLLGKACDHLEINHNYGFGLHLEADDED